LDLYANFKVSTTGRYHTVPVVPPGTWYHWYCYINLITKSRKW